MMTEEILHSSIEHLQGPEEIPYAEDELVVQCLVRNGRPWVRSFVEHHSSLGVKHIVFLDNGSTDGTVETLQGYDNVTVLRTMLPFNEWNKLMRQYLITRFSKNRWSLYMDIDELFDYPYSDVVGLDSLLGYLNSKSYTAVVGQNLDMFPEEPLSDQAHELDKPLKELHRFYDISNIRRKSMRALRNNNTIESDEIELFSGGIRHTLFDYPFWLTRFALVFCGGGVKPMPSHGHDVANAKVADFTSVLFHYKFHDYFREQVARAVREGTYWGDSTEYKKYLEVLDKNPSLQVKRETSKELASVNDLLENGFLVVSDDYVSWVNAEEEKSILSQAPQNEPRGSAEVFLESRRRERAETLIAQRHELRMQRHEQEMQRRLQKLEQQVRDRGRRIRKLERDQQRNQQRNQQRLERRVGRLERRLESRQASLIWRLRKVLHRIKVRTLSLRRSSP